MVQLAWEMRKCRTQKLHFDASYLAASVGQQSAPDYATGKLNEELPSINPVTGDEKMHHEEHDGYLFIKH